MDERQQKTLRGLPKIDELMLRLEGQGGFGSAPRELVKELCRSVVEEMRRKVLDEGGALPPSPYAYALERVTGTIADLGSYRLRRVINATGIIIHTNLGRAPLCLDAMMRIIEIGGGYSNLEYDLASGGRGLRYDHVRHLLCALTGAEDALVVNNNAAAVLLVLNSLAEGREAVVSRGELVEIGGEFRIPEVMEKSGARLREIGATNRTRLADYEKALGAETGVILKVHTSNFRIVGFVEEARLEELTALGGKKGLPVVCDLGSGCLIGLESFGLEGEPTVQEVLSTGVDVVTFSGDKLLGGPQAGIILGKSNIIRKIKENPLNRALRIDKLTLAALEATIMQYLQPEKALKGLRVLQALTEEQTLVLRRARKLLAMVKKTALNGLQLQVERGFSLAGGGALPTRELPTALVLVRSEKISTAKLEARLRRLETPIIARIADDRLIIDMRTVADHELKTVAQGLATVMEVES